MIRRPHDDGWILIRQGDHAVVSGALMARWGNESFAPPSPHAEVLLGIAEHDNGWDAWDRAPEIHGETGYPLQFTELTSEAYVTIWRRGVEHHRKASPYAALLITLHSEHLARRRLERVLGHAVAEEAAPLTALIAEMQTLRLELTNTVMAQSRTTADQLGAEIKANFRLLQIGDFVSLQLCGGLSGVFSVDQVPGQVMGRFVSMTFEPTGEDTLSVTPYPFSEADVVVAVSGRILRKKTFVSSAELLDHLQEADPINLTFRLKPA
ncbi:MAG: DUF3891 family protein [Candidatus Methylomirabilales bacterium]